MESGQIERLLNAFILLHRFNGSNIHGEYSDTKKVQPASLGRWQLQMLGRKYAQRPLLEAVGTKAVVKGRMFSLQQSLPHLPVPPLEQTLDKFLDVVKPILNEEDFTNAQELVADLRKPGGAGLKLQSLLEQRAKQHVNWLSDWWVRVAYLEYRMPCAIHVNPGIVFPLQNFHDQKGQLQYAAKMVSGILDYKVMVDEQTLPVEYMGKTPLCMKQFFSIISSCRIPGKKMDSIVTLTPDKPNPPKHIIVAHNNYFFALDVYGSDGKPLTTYQIYTQLKKIIAQSMHPGKPIGILTTDNRNSWAKAYEKLIKDNQNKASVETIQRSIFLLCLDQPVTHSTPEERNTVAARQMNHGGGSKWNSGNRWFDKTLQFIVGSDGAVGMNYEHAPAEGPPIISIVDHTLNYIETGLDHKAPVEGMKDPVRLPFNVTHDVMMAIETAALELDSTVDDLDMAAFYFKSFGKDFIKSQKLSPDAFFQVGLQLAYFRLYGENTATYESGSLRKFQYGRTETIRSCTIASDKYVRAMDDDNVTPETKVQLLKDAILAHRQYSNEVVNGQGIDRHLLGLKLTAIEAGEDVHEFFTDTAYTTACHFKLSTSQVPSKHAALLCFAPVVPNGYGVCYNPMPKQIVICISTWNTSPDTDTNRMALSLERALTDAHDLLLQTQSSKL